jgi:hypothetical protein
LRNCAVCGFDFTGIGGRNTAEARERPEIESYSRSVLRISCEIALFRFDFTGIDWRNTAVARERPANVTQTFTYIARCNDNQNRDSNKLVRAYGADDKRTETE